MIQIVSARYWFCYFNAVFLLCETSEIHTPHTHVCYVRFFIFRSFNTKTHFNKGTNNIFMIITKIIFIWHGIFCVFVRFFALPILLIWVCFCLEILLFNLYAILYIFLDQIAWNFWAFRFHFCNWKSPFGSSWNFFAICIRFSLAWEKRFRNQTFPRTLNELRESTKICIIICSHRKHITHCIAVEWLKVLSVWKIEFPTAATVFFFILSLYLLKCQKQHWEQGQHTLYRRSDSLHSASLSQL